MRLRFYLFNQAIGSMIMGQLIAWHYRTPMFAKLADHTYVSCGNMGKSWGCWGGKTGGAVLRQGTGSTAQADAIANPDERAGITCYLINGVCHQAANRILLPANITVRGARGYAVSEALFGTYGRPRTLWGLCKAPFHKHTDVKGDIPECTGMVSKFSTLEKRVLDAAGDDCDEGYRGYLAAVQDLYGQADMKTMALSREDTMDFQVRLFFLMAEYKLGDIDEKKGLMEIREKAEHERLKLETLLENNELSVDDFVTRSNGLDLSFQEDVANALSEEDYQALLELERDDFVVLGDPAVAAAGYGSFER